jgi:hypothetical protein
MYGGCLEVHSGRGRIAWRDIPEDYRLVFAMATLGSRYVDPFLDLNLQGIGNTNRWLIPFHIVTAEPAELQCEHFARTVGLRAGGATMIAWEPAFGATAPAPVTTVCDIIRWLKMATGRNPIVRYEKTADYSQLVRECPRMVSPAQEQPTGDNWRFWQQPSLNLGNGRFDRVWWNGDEDALEGFYRWGALPADRVRGAGDSAATELINA